MKRSGILKQSKNKKKQRKTSTALIIPVADDIQHICAIAENRLKEYQKPREKFEKAIKKISDLITSLNEGGFNVELRETERRKTSTRLIYEAELVFEDEVTTNITVKTKTPTEAGSAKALHRAAVEVILMKPAPLNTDDAAEYGRDISNAKIYKLETIDAQLNQQRLERDLADLAAFFRSYKIDQESTSRKLIIHARKLIEENSLLEEPCPV